MIPIPFSTDPGVGVYGFGNIGVQGLSAQGAGVHGQSQTGPALSAEGGGNPLLVLNHSGPGCSQIRGIGAHWVVCGRGEGEGYRVTSACQRRWKPRRRVHDGRSLSSAIGAGNSRLLDEWQRAKISDAV